MTTQKDRYGDILVSNDGARCVLSKRSHGYHIYGLQTVPSLREKGHAKKLLKRLVAFARRTNRQLTLNVGAFGTKGMNDDQLKVFYARFGFNIEGPFNSFMRFTP